jgi:hypothetical protein
MRDPPGGWRESFEHPVKFLRPLDPDQVAGALDADIGCARMRVAMRAITSAGALSSFEPAISRVGTCSRASASRRSKPRSARIIAR